MIDTAVGGMVTRFTHQGKLPTVLAVASSKRSEQSFMESYIKSLSQNDPEHTLVVDKPVWEVKPKETYLLPGQKEVDTFYVGLGNKFLASLVIPDEDSTEEKLNIYREKGYQLLKVPRFFKAKFLEDLERNLCDIAGISSSSANKYMSAAAVKDCINEDFRNPFPDILEIGNDPNDKAQYYNFFDMTAIPPEFKSKPMCIHLDMSISGDMTGIAGVWIAGKKPSTDEENQGKDLLFRLAFSVSIKAPKGRQISFEKNRIFIRWLRSNGFNIQEITSDTFQSYDLQQQLKAENFNCSILSVDRVNTDKICVPYQFLKSAVYEKRFFMYNCKRLFDEFVDVERNINTGKVDHSPCLTGNTLIQLVDGRSLSIIDLLLEQENNKVNYVYSINESTLKIEPKEIVRIWKTKTVTELCEITLDNNEIVKCTPDHRIMLRNGSFIEAKDLLTDDSLMPLYTRVSTKGLEGYRMYYEPISDSWHYEHRKFATEVLDEKYLVHHKDCNKLNNNPSNLIWMSKKEHVKIHSNNGTGAYTEEALKKKSDSVKRWHAEHKNDEKYKKRVAKQSYSLRHNAKGLLAEQKRVDRWNKTLQDIHEYFPEASEEDIKNNLLSYRTRIQHIKGQHTNYENAHKAAQPALTKSNDFIHQLKILYPEIDKDKFKEFFHFDYDSIDPHKKAQWKNRYRKKLYELNNHSVISVKIITCDPIDVYDLEINDNHNFALAAGIFVHNCGHKDALDAVCGATFTCSKYAEKYAYDYGETYDLVQLTNTPGQATSAYQQQITVNFEDELKKVFGDFGIKSNENNCINNYNDNSMLYLEQGIIIL